MTNNDHVSALMRLSVSRELNLSTSQAEQLLALTKELLKWNRTHNLTGHKSLEAAWTDLIMDGLVVASHIKGSSILDIGSGAGFPGLVIALALPHCSVTCLEPRKKRNSFQKHIIRMLGLQERVQAIALRTDQWQDHPYFDTVTLRAVTGLKESLNMALPFLQDKGLVILPRALKDDPLIQPLGMTAQKYTLPSDERVRLLAFFKGPSSQCFT